MTSPKPTRQQAEIADVLEMVLDKGIVINADIAITVDQTELLGIELRAAIASFETAAEYGLAFPSGTDMRRVEQASGRDPLEEDETPDLGIKASSAGADEEETERNPHRKRPVPQPPIQGTPLDDGNETSETEPAADDAGTNEDDESDSEQT